MTRQTNPSWPGLTTYGDVMDDSKVAVRARGNRITFADGKERICATSGLWNVNFGYSREDYTHAIAEASGQLSFYPCFRYSSEFAEKASAALLRTLGTTWKRVVWTTGGSSSVEAAIKIARVYSLLKEEPARRKIASVGNAFHGISIGTMSVTDEDIDKRFYGVSLSDHLKVELDDPDLLNRLERQIPRIAAVLVEPVTGTGTVPLSSTALDNLSQLQKMGVLVIADEVATGFGRVSNVLASDEWGFRPDLLAVSKALTNGAVPGGAVVLGETVDACYSDHPQVGIWHAETGAGHPLVGAAVAVTASIFDNDHELKEHENVRRETTELSRSIVEDVPGLESVGSGAFQTIQYSPDSNRSIDVAGLVDEIRQNGVVVHPSVRGVQIVPPLISPVEDLERIFEVTLSAMTTHRT